MLHDSPLIAVLVIGLGLAFVLGAVANRLRTSLLAGYLLAGVAIGPFTPGFVGDQGLALQLGEIGVLLLMFGVGLHFSVRDLMKVRAVAVPGALVQITLATLMGEGLGWMLGLDLGAGLVFGLSLSIASTVVLLRTLHERQLMGSEAGHIAVAWLVIQDFVTVLALVLLPVLAPLLKNDGSDTATLAELGLTGVVTVAKVAAFVALMLLVGQRVIRFVLHAVVHTGSRELFCLAVLAVVLGAAFVGSEVFGVSFALGAFVVGMVLSGSKLSPRIAEETLPLRNAFSALFFVSIGMLFDPTVLLRDPLSLLIVLSVVLIGTPIASFLVLRALDQPLGAALMIAIGLAQIGEFSFILVGLGVGLDLLGEPIRDLILGASILSIFLNPVLFFMVGRLKPWIDRREATSSNRTNRSLLVTAEDGFRTQKCVSTLRIGAGRRAGRVLPQEG
ncbi:cation:proton antiporter [Belnapia sp. T18]|uniref:Cation:proton antiporter n=2 Tax=Belnapia arida TaxID=2804533 RepID=A0ABS1UAQ8_9PROT|nr:cation:proton antiporter [Belnapia arida]